MGRKGTTRETEGRPDKESGWKKGSAVSLENHFRRWGRESLPRAALLRADCCKHLALKSGHCEQHGGFVKSAGPVPGVDPPMGRLRY